ncbi:MAG: lysostaphin resistance A-like protein [Candidatus Ranarchaeia archaeon]
MSQHADATTKKIIYHSAVHDLSLALAVTICAWIILPFIVLQTTIAVFPLTPIWMILFLQYLLVSLPLILMGVYEIYVNPVQIIVLDEREIIEPEYDLPPLKCTVNRQLSLTGWLGFKDAHTKKIMLTGLIGGISLLIVPFIIVAVILFLGLDRVIPLNPDTPDFLVPHNIIELLLFLAIVLGANALVEELFFRGFIQRFFSRWIPIPLAMLFSAAVFGSFHLSTSIFTAVNAFILGLILSLLYYRTNSIYAAWIAHATYNSVLMVISFIFFSLI